MESNWIDRIISVFSPTMALDRAKSRIALDHLQRMDARMGERFNQGLSAYVGAQTTRRTGEWATAGSDANSALAGSIAKLRDRGRDLCRNNPYAKRAANELVGAQIGTGILPRADTQSEALNKQVNEGFKVWQEECDYEGQLDFAGIQWQAARAVIESGEVLIRLYRRRANSGLHIPLQLQILESDFIDTAKNQQTRDGGWIINGVEFDRRGVRRGYWLFGSHPGSSIMTSPRGYSSSFVPAQNDDGTPNIVHIYLKERPGQTRGVTWYAPVITRFRDLDGYEEAIYMRARLEACIGLVVRSPSGTALQLGVGTTQPDGKVHEELEPGMIAKMNIDEDVTVIDPKPSGGFRDFRTALLQSCAAGLGPMHEQISGDFSGINYSSFKGGQLSFGHVVDAYRWLCFIPMGLRPIWKKFIQSAYLAGQISAPLYGVRWSAPKMPSVDPLKDATATDLRLSGGTETWAEAVGERGYDPDEQLAEIERWHNQFDGKGMIWGWDRRKVAKNGAMQKEEGAEGTDTENDDSSSSDSSDE